MRSELGLDVEPHDRLEDALGNADIIVTAIWSRTPFLGSEQVRAGTHVNTMGADEPWEGGTDGRAAAGCALFL